jgi:predicted MPP superfamily phosphohydrolase
MKSFPSFLFGVVSWALSFGAHRVLLSWVARSFPAFAEKRRPLLVACVTVAALPTLSRYCVLSTKSAVAGVVHAASLVEMMFVLVLAVVILARYGISALGRRVAARRASSRAAAPEIPATSLRAPVADDAITRRAAVEKLGGAMVVGATGLAFGWGMTLGRHGYEVREVVVRIAGLPKALDGYVIAQISDVHAGLFVGERELREGGDLLRKVRPDLLVATGDLVDFDPGHAPALARALVAVAPRDGVFAILGNHDYYAGHVDVSDALRASGITLLVNQSRILRPRDGGGFALAGMDDMWSAAHGGPGPDLTGAMAGLPRDVATILLAHQPKAFDLAAGKVALQLSGHTHGGQIRPADLVMRGPVAGRYDRDGSVLYVNRGFGVAGPPVRLGVPPEITKVVLVSA